MMKVTGFTFIKNAIVYDYPIVEAITSILPICDEFIVAIGDSKDETTALIESINSDKIKVIHTVWDESLREGGAVLADETNKAFQAISDDTDWCFYIQGDEVVHEKYLPIIHAAMLDNLKDSRVEGLLFKYTHFYGSYDYVGSSSRWYEHEIRVVRNNKDIRSYRDAQGFRKWTNGELVKLNVKPIDAYIYHYGWVKEPAAMQRKQESFNKLWHSDEWVEKNVAKVEAFEYEKNISVLAKFEGTHPKVMKKRLNAKNWQFNYDISYNRSTLKEKAKAFLKKYLNLDFSYKNYRILK